MLSRDTYYRLAPLLTVVVVVGAFLISGGDAAGLPLVILLAAALGAIPLAIKKLFDPLWQRMRDRQSPR